MRLFTVFSILSLFSTGCQKKQSLQHLQELNDLCPISAHKEAPPISLLPLKPAQKISRLGSIIWLSPDKTIFNYYAIEEEQDLLDELKSAQDLAQFTGFEPTISLAIAPTTTAEQIVETLTLAQEHGFTTINFLFEATEPPALPTPPNAKKYQKAKAIAQNASPETRQMFLAEELHSQIRFCPSMNRAFQAIAAAPAESRCELMIRGAQEAIPGCPIMTARGMTSTLQVFVEPSFYPSAHTIQISSDVGKAVIPRNYTWKQIAPLLLDQKRLGGLELQTGYQENTVPTEVVPIK